MLGRSGTQSRIVQNPDGEVRLSVLGEAIEQMVKEFQAQATDGSDEIENGERHE